jgi:hypothetical protein
VDPRSVNRHTHTSDGVKEKEMTIKLTASITIRLGSTEYATFGYLTDGIIGTWVDEDMDIVDRPIKDNLTTLMRACIDERDRFERSGNHKATTTSDTESAKLAEQLHRHDGALEGGSFTGWHAHDNPHTNHTHLSRGGTRT